MNDCIQSGVMKLEKGETHSPAVAPSADMSVEGPGPDGLKVDEIEISAYSSNPIIADFTTTAPRAETPTQNTPSAGNR